MALRIILLVKLMKDFDMILIDVEKAFLEPQVEEDLYLKIPKGLEMITKIEEKKCCKLNKAVYGLVQEARQFYQEILTYLVNDRGFEVSKAEPCLVRRKSEDGEIIIGIYVDDILEIGSRKLIRDESEAISKRFGVRVKNKVDEYVGCLIEERQGSLLLHQSRIIDRLVESFEKDIEK